MASSLVLQMSCRPITPFHLGIVSNDQLFAKKEYYFSSGCGEGGKRSKINYKCYSSTNLHVVMYDDNYTA